MPFRNVGSAQIFSQIEEMYKQDAVKGERCLRDLLLHAGDVNGEFLEERFKVLRGEQPFLDFILIDEQGRIQGYWSSFQDLLKNKTPPTVQNLMQESLSSGRFQFLFQAPRDRLLFYLKTEERGVGEVHKSILS